MVIKRRNDSRKHLNFTANVLKNQESEIERNFHFIPPSYEKLSQYPRKIYVINITSMEIYKLAETGKD